MPNLPVARIRSWAPIGLASLFVVSGTLHVVRPSFFESLVPSVLPARDVIVLTSGIAELVCAAGLLTGARWAGSASAWLLVAVFPGNVAYAVTTSGDPTASATLAAAAWIRLPLQVPLVWAALQARRD